MGNGPFGVALNSSTSTLYVANSVSPLTATAYIINFDDGTVSVTSN